MQRIFPSRHKKVYNMDNSLSQPAIYNHLIHRESWNPEHPAGAPISTLGDGRPYLISLCSKNKIVLHGLGHIKQKHSSPSSGGPSCFPGFHAKAHVPA